MKLYDRIKAAYVHEGLYQNRKLDYLLTLALTIYIYAIANFLTEFYFLRSIGVLAVEVFALTSAYVIFYLLLLRRRLEFAANWLAMLGLGFAIYLFFDLMTLRFYNQLLVLMVTVTLGYVKKYQFYSAFVVSAALVFARVLYSEHLAALGHTAPLSLASQFVTLLGIGTLALCVDFLKRALVRELEIAELLKLEMEQDALTKLPNRRKLESWIDSSLHNKDLVILMLDLDHFKRINDSYGHKFGDDVLKQVASVIRSTIRDTDEAYRWGGEEFAVVLEGVDQNLGHCIAERLRQNIAQHAFLSGVTLTVSIGLAHLTSGADAQSIRAHIHKADAALYVAKEQGRNRVVCAKEASDH